MLAHLIPSKGKGMLVLGLPLIIGVLLFIISDAIGLSDQYIFPISLLLSSVIIWIFDGGPALLREGTNANHKAKHTLFWIEIKYWAIVLGITGCVVLGNLWKK